MGMIRSRGYNREAGEGGGLDFQIVLKFAIKVTVHIDHSIFYFLLFYSSNKCSSINTEKQCAQGEMSI